MGLNGLIMGGAGLKSTSSMVLHVLAKPGPQVPGKVSVHVLLRGLYSTAADNRKGTVYVHWPFCSQLCTYCNFNKYVRKSVDNEEMTKCLVKEVGSLLNLSGIREVTSVYFGGGTPSLAQPSTVDSVIDGISRHAHLASEAEVSLEANPTSVEVQKLWDFKVAGVNRLSLGVQSLNDEALKLFNRDHNSKEAQSVLQQARKIFPGRTNIDMIFGRPGQTHSSWVEELSEVLNICDNHVSLYQLTVEHGTALEKSIKKKELILPDPDSIADMYESAVQMLEDTELNRYEVSNFAKPGFESQHNLSYWNGIPYVGIGPGAHSRFELKDISGFVSSINTLEPNAWMRKVHLAGHGIQKTVQISRRQRLEEVVATSLRTSEGLTHEVWNSFGVRGQIQDVFLGQSEAGHHHLGELFEAGLLLVDHKGIRATRKGLMLLDSILPKVLVAMEYYTHI